MTQIIFITILGVDVGLRVIFLEYTKLFDYFRALGRVSNHEVVLHLR